MSPGLLGVLLLIIEVDLHLIIVVVVLHQIIVVHHLITIPEDHQIIEGQQIIEGLQIEVHQIIEVHLTTEVLQITEGLHLIITALIPLMDTGVGILVLLIEGGDLLQEVVVQVALHPTEVL
jgi:hypothetical protein